MSCPVLGQFQDKHDKNTTNVVCDSITPHCFVKMRHTSPFCNIYRGMGQEDKQN